MRTLAIVCLVWAVTVTAFLIVERERAMSFRRLFLNERRLRRRWERFARTERGLRTHWESRFANEATLTAAFRNLWAQDAARELASRAERNGRKLELVEKEEGA